MSGNDSSTGGYLVAASTPSPLEDDALVDFLHDVVEGITGLPGSLIRPRWQSDPPNLPDKSVTWGSIGVVSRKTEGYPQTSHQDGVGDMLVRYERIDVALTFYGPACESAAAILRDGLFIAQNREALSLAGYGLRDVSDIDTVPELLKGQWLSRADVTVTMMRQIKRVYPVLSVASLQGTLIAAGSAGVLTRTVNAGG